MKSINKFLAITAFCGLAMITGCKNESRELLRNPGNVNERHIVQPGDTYWKYAKKLQSECPALTKLDTREIVYFMKHDMNGNRELYSWDKINFPKYDCE